MRPLLHSESDEGMSLIELVIALSLLVMVLSAAYMALFATSKAADGMDARQQASEQNRTTIDRVTREMRQSVEVVEGSGVFRSASARACEFYSDVNRDGKPELVGYRVYNAQLLRKVTNSSTAVPPYNFNLPQAEVPVILTIDPAYTGSVFTFWTNDDPPVQVTGANLGDISAVDIHIVALSKVGREQASIDLETWVKIRSVHNTID